MADVRIGGIKIVLDADDPAVITRWMGRVPRRVKKAMHQRVYHLSNRDRLNANAKRYYRDHRNGELEKAREWYKRTKAERLAAQKARYYHNVKASRAALRARYAADPEKYREAQRRREAAKRQATMILRLALDWMVVLNQKRALDGGLSVGRE